MERKIAVIRPTGTPTRMAPAVPAKEVRIMAKMPKSLVDAYQRVPKRKLMGPISKMAGMPASVVSRADEILKNLVKVYGTDEIVPSKSPKLRGRKQASVKDAVEEADKGASMQLSMFQLDDPVLVQIRDQIKGLDIDSLTPLEALNKLNEIKKTAGI